MTSCNFCGGRFSTKSNLKIHQSTAKYCLLLQGTGSGSRFKCDYCNKSYASKSKLAYHHGHHCTPKRLADKDVLLTDKDTLNEELQAQIQILEKENSNLLLMVKDRINAVSETIDERNCVIQKKNEEIIALKAKYEVCEDHYTKEVSKTKNTTTYNITQQKLDSIPIMTIEPLTDKYIQRKIDEEFTYEKFRRDPLGSIVDLIVGMISIVNKDGIREMNYACTDVSRYKCHRLLESRDWKRDSGAYHINKILNKLSAYSVDYCEKMRKSVKTDQVDTMKDADVIISQMNKIQRIQRGVEIDDGPDRKHLFGKIRGRICSKAAI